VVIVDAETGAVADPVLVDRSSGRPLAAPAFRSAPGPAADARTRAKHAPHRHVPHPAAPAGEAHV